MLCQKYQKAKGVRVDSKNPIKPKRPQKPIVMPSKKHRARATKGARPSKSVPSPYVEADPSSSNPFAQLAQMVLDNGGATQFYWNGTPSPFVATPEQFRTLKTDIVENYTANPHPHTDYIDQLNILENMLSTTGNISKDESIIWAMNVIWLMEKNLVPSDDRTGYMTINTGGGGVFDMSIFA